MPQPEAKKIHDRPQSMGGDTPWTDSPRPRSSFDGDVSALERDLSARVDGEVRFDSGSKATYSTDSSNYRQVPIGVVIPHSTDALAEAVTVCYEHGAPITHRGAGTSLAGQTTNRAVIIDGSKYLDRILEVNPDEQWAHVEPGVRRDQLTEKTEAEHNLTFAPDTSTHEYATFGGMIGNNSCGMHSQMAGRTQDNVEEMEVLLYDGTRLTVGPTSEDELEQIIEDGGRKGTIYRRLRDLRDEHADKIRDRYPDIPRRVSGYNLEELLPENGFHVARALVGTEGTCATVLSAKVKLVHSPPYRALLVLGFKDIYDAGDHVMGVGEQGALALEGMDHELINEVRRKHFHPEYLHVLPEGYAFLIAEFGGATQDEADANAREAQAAIEEKDWPALIETEVVGDPEAREEIWAIREAGLAVTAHRPDGKEAWPGWEDSAIPPESAGDYMRDLRDLYDEYGYDAALYGHFGQGCIHTRIPFDLRTDEGISQYRSFIDEASDLCATYGGSFSAEHGDGQARGELLPKMYGETLIEAFREFKAIWDPEGKMNPGKVVDPNRLDENLRLGTDYHPQEPDTHFAYPEDNGRFSHAALRCVGVGKCRKHEVESETVMCPSFLATQEEKHTTRGRSRLLFEMLEGDETPNAWDNDDVYEALDLCLACKGCKSDCPVNVDMATYKAEFLSHYYEERDNVRPRHAYAFGLIYWWARLASRVPSLANFVTQTPGLSTVAKWIGGVAQERSVPPFPPQTFREWFMEREGVAKSEGLWVTHHSNDTMHRIAEENTAQDRATGTPVQEVILFPDTFNNFLKPDTGKAAVAVLEEAGFQVAIPDQTLCCGRPLYDYGWIDPAKRLWREQLEALRGHYRSGTPIIGLEPSCVAAFRDELPNLFPDDEDARRLSQNVYTLGEFLENEADDYEPPSLNREALVHGHCHHKSIMGADSEKSLLRQMGLDFDDFVPASCCGMAGAFGFEAEHYDVSIQAGEHKLLPEVRDAASDTLIIADGFSCREQIEQTTDRRALHLAEVLHLAEHQNGQAVRSPENFYAEQLRFSANDTTEIPSLSLTETLLLGGGAFLTSAALSYLFQRQ